MCRPDIDSSLLRTELCIVAILQQKCEMIVHLQILKACGIKDAITCTLYVYYSSPFYS